MASGASSQVPVYVSKFYSSVFRTGMANIGGLGARAYYMRNIMHNSPGFEGYCHPLASRTSNGQRFRDPD